MNGLISQWKDKAFFHLIHPVRQDRPRCCPKDISKPQVCVWFPEPESRKPHVLLKSTSIFISIVERRNYSRIRPQDSRGRQRYVRYTFFPVSPAGTYGPWAQHTALCSHSLRFTLSEGTKKENLQAMISVAHTPLNPRYLGLWGHACSVYLWDATSYVVLKIFISYLSLDTKLQAVPESQWLHLSQKAWNESWLPLPLNLLWLWSTHLR